MTAKETAKNELRDIFTLFQKNVDAVGSRKALKAQYSKGFARLEKEVNEKTKNFIHAYFQDITIEKEYMPVFNETVNWYCANDLGKAINTFDVDEVEKVIDDLFFFIINNGEDNVKKIK